MIMIISTSSAAYATEITFGDRNPFNEGWGSPETKRLQSLSSNNGELIVAKGDGYEVKIVSSNNNEWNIIATGIMPITGLEFTLYYQSNQQGNTEVFKTTVTVSGDGYRSVPIVEGITGTGSNSMNEVRVDTSILTDDIVGDGAGDGSDDVVEDIVGDGAGDGSDDVVEDIVGDGAGDGSDDVVDVTEDNKFSGAEDIEQLDPNGSEPVEHDTTPKTTQVLQQPTPDEYQEEEEHTPSSVADDIDPSTHKEVVVSAESEPIAHSAHMQNTGLPIGLLVALLISILVAVRIKK